MTFRDREYTSKEYKEWRKAVYARDHYRCQFPNCRTRTKKLQAHHIRRWADEPTLRWSIDNGITLCPHHHIKVTGNEEAYASMFLRILKPSSSSVLLGLMMLRASETQDQSIPETEET